MQHAFASVPPIRLPDHLRYMEGCGLCDYGKFYQGDKHELHAALKLQHANPTEKDVHLWRQGLISFCACEGGQAAERVLIHVGELMAGDDESFQHEMAAAKQQRLDRLFADAEVPPSYARFSFKGYVDLAGRDAGKQQAIAAIKEYYTAGHIMAPHGKRHGLLLWGRSDMGKTGALCPLFLHYVRNGQPGLWLQYNDLMAAVKQFDGGQVEDRIGAAKNVEYLFIDDFGDPAAERTATNYTREVMFRILDYRNSSMRPTFITSNLDPRKMAGQFSERIFKRLSELCAIVEVGGTPMRDLMDSGRKKWQPLAEFA